MSNFLEIPIRIFSTFYNVVSNSYYWLTSKVPILSDLSDVFNDWPEWVRELGPFGDLINLIAEFGGLTVIELMFGGALIGILSYAILKFFVPT
jgi:hypothetical protein